MRRLILVVLAVAAIMGSAVPALAQTKPVNPTVAEFNPVPEEYAQIIRAEIAYFAPGATNPVNPPVSLGKPALTATGCTAPTTDPCVRVTINTQPVPLGLDYTAKVRVIAVINAVEMPSEWSDPSNPFDRKPGKPGKPVIK